MNKNSIYKLLSVLLFVWGMVAFGQFSTVFAAPQDQPAVPLVRCDGDGNPYTVAGAYNCSSTWQTNPHNCYHCWAEDDGVVHYGWYDLPDGYTYHVGTTIQQNRYKAYDLIFGDTGSWCSNAMCGCTVECVCVARNCPAAIPSNKFRQTPAYVNGKSRDCTDKCSPVEASCAPSYVNTAPSCDILPKVIKGTHGAGPVSFELTTTDIDYGDEVRVVGYETQNQAGILNNCVDLQTTGGASLLGASVKSGSSDAQKIITGKVTVLANPDTAHGIYENIGGKLVCKGTLIVEIRDTIGAQDVYDASASSKCQVAIEIENNAPTLSEVAIYDNDTNPTLRKPGDLVNGTPLYIGSSLEAKRASYCTAAMDVKKPGVCPDNYSNALSSRKNPFTLEFTVSDSNGAKDIMQAGIWIQRSDVDVRNARFPIQSAGIRNSIQALYSEQESIQFGGFGNRWYYISRGCIATNCGENNIATSTKLRFTGLSLISGLGSVVTENGNVSQSSYSSSPYIEWLKAGFPDCLGKVTGCSAANVPAASKELATTNQSLWGNYSWASSIDQNHLLCYKSTTPNPEVRNNGGICPTDCAACIAKNGVTSVAADSLKFSFKIFLNDTDGGSGMAAGQYSVFVSALDKVGAPLQNVSGRGPEGWIKFDKDGNPCSTPLCAAGDFSLNFDPIPPRITNINPQIPPNLGTDDVVEVTMLLSDYGSKLAGKTNDFMIHEELLDGDPLERSWMKPTTVSNCDSPLELNGANNKSTVTGSPETKQLSIFAKCAIPGENIVAGACAYDNAGNMGCYTNGTNYIFVAPWLKTSLGDVYSNTNSGGSAFKNYTIPNTPDQTANTLPAPFADQANTAATGIIMSAGTIAIAGGKTFGGAEVYPLGFSTRSTAPQEYYRTTDAGAFTLPGTISSLPLNVYENLRVITQKNCALMNDTATKCIESTNLSSTKTLDEYKVITLSGTVTIESTLTCQNTSVIFIEKNSNVNVSAPILKQSINSGCIFVLAAGTVFTVKDVPAGDLASGDTAKPNIDSIQAGIVASGASIVVEKGKYGAITRRADRLVLTGFLYSSSKEPILQRSLAPVDNKKYPAEQFIYDPNLLDSFRNLLGYEKTVDVICGTSTHVFCGRK